MTNTNSADILANCKTISDYFYYTSALLKGHFILSSGLHSDHYVQCAKLFIYPEIAQRICTELVLKIKQTFTIDKIDFILSPAIGAITVGYEVSRQLGIPYIFCERVDRIFVLRRGFTEVLESKPRKKNILVVEDVITTGKSSFAAFDCIKAYNCNLIGVAALVNRSNSEIIYNETSVPIVSLLKADFKLYEPHEIPHDLKNIPPIILGSNKNTIQKKKD